jgi:hypothetical protein
MTVMEGLSGEGPGSRGKGKENDGGDKAVYEDGTH